MTQKVNGKKPEHLTGSDQIDSPDDSRNEELERMVSVSLSSDWGENRTIPTWMIKTISAIVGAAAVLLFFLGHLVKNVCLAGIRSVN